MSTGMFCKHKWVILSETTTESAYQHAASIGGNVKTNDEDMLKRKHIQIVTCEKCGKLKRFVEVL